MAKLSITASADFAGKARSTIQRSIKNGTLSATVDAQGNKTIDTSELIRVFGEPDNVARGTSQNVASDSILQQSLQSEKDRNDTQQKEIEFLRKMIEKQNAQIENHIDQVELMQKQITKLSDELINANKPVGLLSWLKK